MWRRPTQKAGGSDAPHELHIRPAFVLLHSSDSPRVLSWRSAHRDCILAPFAYNRTFKPFTFASAIKQLCRKIFNSMWPTVGCGLKTMVYDYKRACNRHSKGNKLEQYSLSSPHNIDVWRCVCVCVVSHYVLVGGWGFSLS